MKPKTPRGTKRRERRGQGSARDYARARTELANVTVAERAARLERMRSEVIERRAVEAQVGDALRLIRARWSAWPKRAAPAIAGELNADVRTVERLLTRYVRMQLAEIGDEPFKIAG